MAKNCYFYIDDVIWTLRELTNQKPDSMFDIPFLKMLKTAHDKYGMKVQLNLFYRTDFFYGEDEFCLKDVTDKYKSEWEANSDWLRLGFHSKQEFPDYPYVNADYNLVKSNFEEIKNEVYRFAGPKTFAANVTTHWLPMSREGCAALHDCGVKIMTVSTGDRHEYDPESNVLEYVHASRVLTNRKKETGVFYRKLDNGTSLPSVCGYNHLKPEKIDAIRYKKEYYHDEETGMNFKQLCYGPVLNSCTMDMIPQRLEPHMENEYLGYATHEQYFYPKYFLYQPDYADKLFLAAKIVSENGYEFFFPEEMVKE